MFTQLFSKQGWVYLIKNSLIISAFICLVKIIAG